MRIKIVTLISAIAVLALIAEPASASGIHKGGRGCGALVTQVHPDLEEHARKEEIAKCRRDPDAYIKAAGL